MYKRFYCSKLFASKGATVLIADILFPKDEIIATEIGDKFYYLGVSDENGSATNPQQWGSCYEY